MSTVEGEVYPWIGGRASKEYASGEPPVETAVDGGLRCNLAGVRCRE